MTDKIKEIMTLKDVAKYLSLSEHTIYKKVERRQMPFTKVGNLLRFHKNVIDKWIIDHTTYPIKSLYDEFELLYEQFHFKKWLEAKGIDYNKVGEKELVEELKKAIEELKEEAK